MAYEELDLYGSSDDLLDALGVSGADYVGAAAGPMAKLQGGFFAKPGMLAQPMGSPGVMQLHPAIMKAAASGLRMAQQQKKNQRLRQLAYAGVIPQIPLGIRRDAKTGGNVPANQDVTLSPEPGVPLRITNFTVSPTIAGLFLIGEIKVARVDMLAGADAVPATLFTPESRHPPFENPILAAGAQIVTTVENIDSADHPFYGAFQGIDLTPPYARMV